MFSEDELRTLEDLALVLAEVTRSASAASATLLALLAAREPPDRPRTRRRRRAQQRNASPLRAVEPPQD